VNNDGLHYEQPDFLKISSQQLTKIFANNFFSYFWMTQAALPYMKKDRPSSTHHLSQHIAEAAPLSTTHPQKVQL